MIYEIEELTPLTYRGFNIYTNPDWDKRPAPTDIYSAGKRRYIYMNQGYDGGTNDWGDMDSIEECVEQIDMYHEGGGTNYPNSDWWSGGFAENH